MTALTLAVFCLITFDRVLIFAHVTPNHQSANAFGSGFNPGMGAGMKTLEDCPTHRFWNKWS